MSLIFLIPPVVLVFLVWSSNRFQKAQRAQQAIRRSREIGSSSPHSSLANPACGLIADPQKVERAVPARCGEAALDLAKRN